MLKKFFLLAALLSSGAFFISCSPSVSIKPKSDGEVFFSFKTGFSDNAAKLLRSISGIGESEQIFSMEDIQSALKSLKIKDAKVQSLSPTQIVTDGIVPAFAQDELSKSGILKSSKNSVSLSLGPSQFNALYSILDETSQAYFDMLMIPSLMGETMDIEEYKKLLSSLYGASFVNELLDGFLEIKISDPSGKQKLSEKISIGEILTLSKTKIWSVSW